MCATLWKYSEEDSLTDLTFLEFLKDDIIKRSY